MERSERSILTGVAVLRVAAWIWMLVVLVAQRHDLAGSWHAVLAWLLVAIAGAFTVAAAAMIRIRPEPLMEPPALLFELAVAVALMSLDGLVFSHGHIGTGQSSLASSWPLAAVLSAGVAYGEIGGLSAGVAVGIARAASVPLNGVAITSLRSPVVISILSSLVLYALAGAVAGFVVRLLREADDRVARARAREDVARTLHDGVLQTLTLVERRSPDTQLATLAREQERELRTFLAGYSDEHAGGYRRSGVRGRYRGHGSVAAGELEARLRRVAGRFEEAYGGRVEVILARDVPCVSLLRAEALAGAVGEALVNSGKHGHAGKATVFVEPAEHDKLFCSVKDDGEGFDPSTVREGRGLRGSVRGRVEEIGGRVEIDGAPGRGAEVRMWV